MVTDMYPLLHGLMMIPLWAIDVTIGFGHHGCDHGMRDQRFVEEPFSGRYWPRYRSPVRGKTFFGVWKHEDRHLYK